MGLISKIYWQWLPELSKLFKLFIEILYSYRSSFWKNQLDKSLMACMMLIDLQKVFDAIDDDMLLKILSDIGFLNHANGWFKSYFSNRLHRLYLENCYSDPSNTTCEVSKGSILGPLLFLINVNDIPQAVKSNYFSMC